MLLIQTYPLLWFVLFMALLSLACFLFHAREILNQEDLNEGSLTKEIAYRTQVPLTVQAVFM